MAITYKKNAQNVFSVPLYALFILWFTLSVLLAVFMSVIGYFVPSKICQIGIYVLLSLVTILAIWRAQSLTKSVIEAKTTGQYITQKAADKQVTKSLLATMSVNRIQDTPFISVPRVRVCDSRPSHISVEVEKLAGIYDIDKMTEDINPSYWDKLTNYAVMSAIITTD